MHNYKIFLFIILTYSFLFSKNDTLKINYDNYLTKKNSLKYFIENWRSENFKNGDLTNELILSSIKYYNEDLYLVWLDTLSKPTFIDTIFYENNVTNKLIKSIINSNYLGKKATKDNLFDLKKKFNYPFIDFISDPSYMIYNEDNLALFVPMKLNFKNFFSGIFGYNSQNRLSGNIDLSLSNIFGLSTTLDFNWFRLNENSQDIFMQYSIPFIKILNYGIKFNFSQSLQNNLFVKYSNEFEITSFYSNFGKYSFGIKNTKNNPTDFGYENGYNSYQTKNILLNHYYEIKKNLYFNQKITIGNYIQNFEEKQILNYYFDGFHSYKLNNLFNLNFNLRYGKVHINNEISIPDGEKYRFGGAKTFRGYEELFFISDEFLINQIELRYGTNINSTIFVFTDFGKANIELNNIFSYGVGIIQPVSIGYLKLEYAINKLDKLSNGKIHFTILSSIK